MAVGSVRLARMMIEEEAHGLLAYVLVRLMVRVHELLAQGLVAHKSGCL